MVLLFHNDRNSYLTLRIDYTNGLGNVIDSMIWIRNLDSRSHCIFFVVVGTAFITTTPGVKKVTSLDKTGEFAIYCDVIQSINKRYFLNLF